MSSGLRIVGYTCPHMTLTAAPGVLRVFAPWCGCEMRPVYADSQP